MQVDAEGMSQPLLIQQLNTPGQHSGLCLNTHEDITTARARDTGHGYTGRLSKKLILFYTLTQGQLNYTKFTVICYSWARLVGTACVCLGWVIFTKSCVNSKPFTDWRQKAAHYGSLVSVKVSIKTGKTSCKERKDPDPKLKWETFIWKWRSVQQCMSSLGEHLHTGTRVECLWSRRVRQRRSACRVDTGA